ncbi:hypothetical protein BBJ28_00011989 [Nothophytophthora sp. Chile5]|nr:hypothetical protein BBJ28_00011989 [Nothophytophthora sp. Chile5]
MQSNCLIGTNSGFGAENPGSCAVLAPSTHSPTNIQKHSHTKEVRSSSMDFGGAAAGAATAPRVNKKTMGAYVGRTVALVGAVESHTPTAAVLRTSDGEIVNVKPQPGSNYGSKVVEVIGRVVDTETIQEFKATPFGDDFDLENYDQLVQLAQTKFRQLFE